MYRHLHYRPPFLQFLLKLKGYGVGREENRGGKHVGAGEPRGEGYSKTHFAEVHLLFSQQSFSQCLCSVRRAAIRKNLSAAPHSDQLTPCLTHINYKGWALCSDAWIQELNTFNLPTSQAAPSQLSSPQQYHTKGTEGGKTSGKPAFRDRKHSLALSWRTICR